MRLPSLKVAHRLLIGFGALAFLVLVVAAAVWGSAMWQGQRLQELERSGTASLDHASGMAEAAQAAYKGAVAIAMSSMRTEDAGAAPTAPSDPSRIESALGEFDAHLAAAMQLAPGDGSRLREISTAQTGFASAMRHLSALARNPDTQAEQIVSHFRMEAEPYYHDRLEPLLAEHVAATRAAIVQHVEAAETTRRWSMLFLLGGMSLLMAGVIAIAAISTRHVGGGLERLASATRSIVAGQLMTPLRIASDDEFGEITEALNELVVSLSSATVSRTYVENIVHNMADPLLVVDPDVCISMVNQALLDMLGYETHAVVGASITRVFAYAGRNRGAMIKRDIERGLSRNVESAFRTRDGRPIPVSISCALVRSDGEIRGLVIVAKDITQQKKREEELIRARDEAERMVQLRDAFLANMSHEIRTPLTGILGSAQILAEAVEGEHRNLARIIEDAGTRLLDTINSVLEMARIEAGEVQPEMEILDFALEAEAVSNVLRPIAQKKGLMLTVEPPVSGIVAAQLDRSCLNRILNNLVGNAIKFTNEGGVSIEVRSVDDDAVITVRDSGIGISKEFLPHLFDDFKQESTGLKRSHEGSGLGLAITKKLVEMMGGQIEVDSVKGLGSAFTIRFHRAPVGAVVAAGSPSDATNERAAAELRAEAPWEVEASNPEVRLTPPLPPEERAARDILLIEDNQQNAYMARFMLEGFTTDVANTPDEAVELARRHQYAVLLVDINLGTDVSGIDLLKTIRKIRGYQRAQAVAVTAYALPGDRERFLKEGFDDYVSKPYRKEALHASIQRAMEAREQPSGASLDEVFDSFKETVDAVGGAQARDARAPATAAPSPAAPPAAYPTASPDDFLPTDYRPSAGEHQSAPPAGTRGQPPVAAEVRDPASDAGDGSGWPPIGPRR